MTPTTALRLTGRDALALLHRIGTQKLDDITSGQARATLFCDFRGRLLHRAAAGMTSDGAVWLLRDDAPGEELAAFLDRHVFRDDVRIEDRSDDLPVIAVAADTESPTGVVREREGVPVAMRVESAVGLVCGTAAGAQLDPAARVRLGRPAHRHEIRDAFTPFEVGLAHEVHLDKGCFTGQEVLMRLVTYRSVKRRLVRVGGDGAAPVTPAELRGDDGADGVLTSAVADGSGWMGLAVVRNEIVESGGRLKTADGANVEIREALPLTRALGRP
jgi:folate-binding protein YgfZ